MIVLHSSIINNVLSRRGYVERLRRGAVLRRRLTQFATSPRWQPVEVLTLLGTLYSAACMLDNAPFTSRRSAIDRRTAQNCSVSDCASAPVSLVKFTTDDSTS